jgi:para-nitrobenzyl esterase
MIEMRRLPLLIAAVALAWMAGATAHGDGPSRRDDVVRRTQYGPVVGTDDSRRNGTYAWKGIPFARPPVGELRWKAPVEPCIGRLGRRR